MSNMEIVEKLALTSVSESLDSSAAWFRLAERAEREGHPDVARDLLDEAVRAEVLEQQERADDREHLHLLV